MRTIKVRLGKCVDVFTLITDTLVVNASGEEGTQLPTTQRGFLHNPNSWAQRPTRPCPPSTHRPSIPFNSAIVMNSASLYFGIVIINII